MCMHPDAVPPLIFTDYYYIVTERQSRHSVHTHCVLMMRVLQCLHTFPYLDDVTVEKLLTLQPDVDVLQLLTYRSMQCDVDVIRRPEKAPVHPVLRDLPQNVRASRELTSLS